MHVHVYRSTFSSTCIISYPRTEQSHQSMNKSKRRHLTLHRGGTRLPPPFHRGNGAQGVGMPSPRHRGYHWQSTARASCRLRSRSCPGHHRGACPCRTPSSKGTEEYGNQVRGSTCLLLLRSRVRSSATNNCTSLVSQDREHI